MSVAKYKADPEEVKQLLRSISMIDINYRY